jgi:ADP-heptose:LPS heptosyltransferase
LHGCYKKARLGGIALAFNGVTHRARILADRLLGTPAAFVFNGIARVLGTILRRNHEISSNNVNYIVVAKLIGMGSILQSKPLLKALRDHYPNAKLTFVTMRSNADLVTRLGCVDEVLTLDDGSVPSLALSTMKTVVGLIRRHADIYFDLEVYSAFASLLALWAVTRNRIGFYRRSVAFKHGIYTHLVYFNTRMPVRQLYLQLGRVAGVASGQSELTGPIRIDSDDRLAVKQLLAEFPGWQVDKPYIVINPNASDLLLERRWPAECFVETVQRLVGLGHQIVFIGVANERGYVESLHAKLTADEQLHVANTAGMLSLGELLALLDGAACVLTNDTGPMHMAIALRRPTVCLFGPANPEHYGQQLANVDIFYARVFCSPCLYEADQPPCNGNNICMQQIRPQPVVQSVLRLMKQDLASEDPPARPDSKRGTSPSRRRIARQAVISDAPDKSPLGVVVRGSLTGPLFRSPTISRN